MKFPKTLAPSNHGGFTILEMLISLSILVILAAMTLPFTVKFYQRYQLDAERSLLLSVLRNARTLSLGGYGSASHGVYRTTSEYVVYAGSNYFSRDASSDITFARDDAITITGPTDLIFLYLTGKVASSSYTLSNSAKTATIKVNHEGRIDW